MTTFPALAIRRPGRLCYLSVAKPDPAVCGLRLYVEHNNANAQKTYESLGMADAGYRMYEAGTRG